MRRKLMPVLSITILFLMVFLTSCSTIQEKVHLPESIKMPEGLSLKELLGDDANSESNNGITDLSALEVMTPQELQSLTLENAEPTLPALVPLGDMPQMTLEPVAITPEVANTPDAEEAAESVEANKAETDETAPEAVGGLLAPKAVTPTFVPQYQVLEAMVYTTNFFHQDLGCNWMGIAGQVFDKNGHPLIKVIVEVKGIVNGKVFSKLHMTGLAPAYGQGGFEIPLSTTGAFKSVNQMAITLYDLNGKRLSTPLIFSTTDDCTKNLIIINYQKK